MGAVKQALMEITEDDMKGDFDVTVDPAKIYRKPQRKVVICDLDGTLADINHRLHCLDEKDWAGFWAAVPQDTPNQWCVDLLYGMELLGYEVIFVSGRNEVARADTEKWLTDLELNRTLYMRYKDDRRPDYVVKKEIYRKYLADREVVFVVEDRTQVVEMWRAQGLTVLQCDEGSF
jgi:FMN phosphatase YigB (HAD superfamily)